MEVKDQHTLCVVLQALNCSLICQSGAWAKQVNEIEIFQVSFWESFAPSGKRFCPAEYFVIDSKAIENSGRSCNTVVSGNWSYIGGACGSGIYNHILTCARF